MPWILIVICLLSLTAIFIIATIMTLQMVDLHFLKKTTPHWSLLLLSFVFPILAFSMIMLLFKTFGFI